ncbi:MAG: monovalent cation/H(+) antiporter subunit G [Actinomycetota bacterium]|nr:monovalent cation/H(+) antiporter subunit G [Actinomycetota bacterium]
MNVHPIVMAITIVFACIGAFFFLVGTIGMLRLPDFYSRTHAATKCDTLGAGSILVALAVYTGLKPDAFKILAIAAFVLLTSPTAGHALARAAFRSGLAPWTRSPRADGDQT